MRFSPSPVPVGRGAEQRDETGIFASPDEIGARYRVELLPFPTFGATGVEARDAAPEPRRVAWHQVLHAFAAAVGEPEGVSTVVFDLVLQIKESEAVVCRFDADPHEGASEVAAALLESLGPTRCCPALRELAAHGRPDRWFPDLVALAEDRLAALGIS